MEKRKKYNKTVKLEITRRNVHGSEIKSEREIDESIAKYIKWLNNNKYYTSSSCSGISKDHPYDNRKRVGKIIFPLRTIDKKLHRPLINAIKSLNVFINTSYTIKKSYIEYWKKNKDKQVPKDKIIIAELYCVFCKPDNINYETKHKDFRENRYSDDKTLDKFELLIKILEKSNKGDPLSMDEYPNGYSKNEEDK
jgi:hypothetical protein